MNTTNNYVVNNVTCLLSWSESITKENEKIEHLFWLNVQTGELSNQSKKLKDWGVVTLLINKRTLSFDIEENLKLSTSAKKTYLATAALFKDLFFTPDKSLFFLANEIPENLKNLAKACFGEEKCTLLMKVSSKWQFMHEIESLALERLESPEALQETEIALIAKLFSSSPLEESYASQTLDQYHPAFIFSQLDKAFHALKNGIPFESTSEDPTSENKFAGNNESYFLLDMDKKPLWVFKPENGEAVNSSGFSGLKGIPAGKSAIREHVAALLNYNRRFPIPYTAYVNIDNRKGSLQLFVSDSVKLSKLRSFRNSREQLEQLPPESFHALLVFDLIFCNCDRNGANILCKEMEIVGIDHGGCMTASSEDPISMEYLTLKQVAHQPFVQAIKDYIFRELDSEENGNIMRRHGIEDNAIKWMEIAANILKQSIELSDESFKRNGIFLSPGDIATVVIKLREEFWKNSSPKYIQMVFLELLDMKAKIFTLHKQNNLTYQSFDNLKKEVMAIIKAEAKELEYIQRTIRLNIFFNKILPNYCNSLTGQDFNL